MAIGDDALAAGMPLVNGNAANSASAIDDYINETRDYIAQRTSAVTPVAKGGTGATDAAAARSNLAAPETAVAGLKFTTPGFGRISYQAPGVAYETELAAYAQVSSKANASDLNAVREGGMSSSVYNRTLGGSYRVVYVAADGTLGWVSSSRKAKKDIRPAHVDVDAVLAMELVTFLYKVAVDTGREGITQWGLIAEQLDALGLHWLVDYGASGDPEGVRYDRLALALLPVTQNLAARLTAIENHLDALGAELDA